ASVEPPSGWLSVSVSALTGFAPPPRPPRPRPPRRLLRRFAAAVPSADDPASPPSAGCSPLSVVSRSAVSDSAVFADPADPEAPPDRLRGLFAPPRLLRRRGRGDGDAPSLDAVSPVGSDACGSSAAAIEE